MAETRQTTARVMPVGTTHASQGAGDATTAGEKRIGGVIADVSGDVTLIAGSGMTIVADDAVDSITFSATGPTAPATHYETYHSAGIVQAGVDVLFLSRHPSENAFTRLITDEDITVTSIEIQMYIGWAQWTAGNFDAKVWVDTTDSATVSHALGDFVQFNSGNDPDGGAAAADVRAVSDTISVPVLAGQSLSVQVDATGMTATDDPTVIVVLGYE